MGLGDTDGDTLSDLAVGTPLNGEVCGFWYYEPCEVGGAVFVFGGDVLAGGGVIAAEDLDTVIYPDSGDGWLESPRAGHSVTGPGDPDGDGLGDLWNRHALWQPRRPCAALRVRHRALARGLLAPRAARSPQADSLA